MDEKSAYQLLLELTPEEQKSDVERIFRENKQIEDENDCLFQIILVMGIYQNFIKEIPQQFQNAIDEFHRNANSELKAIVKITKINAKIERSLKHFTIAMYVFILILTLLVAGNYFVCTSSYATVDKSISPIKTPVFKAKSEVYEKDIQKKEKHYSGYLDQDKHNE